MRQMIPYIKPRCDKQHRIDCPRSANKLGPLCCYIAVVHLCSHEKIFLLQHYLPYIYHILKEFLLLFDGSVVKINALSDVYSFYLHFLSMISGDFF